jgi:hypothetical protein
MSMIKIIKCVNRCGRPNLDVHYPIFPDTEYYCIECAENTDPDSDESINYYETSDDLATNMELVEVKGETFMIYKDPSYYIPYNKPYPKVFHIDVSERYDPYPIKANEIRNSEEPERKLGLYNIIIQEIPS